MAESAHRSYGPRLRTMRNRRDFLRLRGGARWSGKAFVVEGKKRVDRAGDGIRFGFTISGKVGLAHERNRMRRRLTHALRLAPMPAVLADWDCVVIARRAALDLPFEDLIRDFAAALSRLADPRPPPGTPRHAGRAPAARKEPRNAEP